MGISPGGLERQRPFRPIFGREKNHTRLEARDPQFAICNSLRCWLILKQEAMKSGNLLRGFMASCFIYFQTEPTTFPPPHPPGAAPASAAGGNSFKFLENFTCGGGWFNATLIIGFSRPISDHASPPICRRSPSGNAPPTLHPSLQDQSVSHRAFPRLLSF